MTNKEILDEAYRMLKEPLSESPVEYRAWVWKCKIVAQFIEEERRRQDDPSFVPTKGLKNTVYISEPDPKGPRLCGGNKNLDEERKKN